MTALALILAAVLALLATLRTRALLGRLTLRIPAQIDNITFATTLLTLALVVLGLGNYYFSGRQDDERARLETRLGVLEDLSGLRARLLEDYLLLLSHSLVLKNYTAYEQVRGASINNRPPWEEVVNEPTLAQLAQARAAFTDLQMLARQVLDWNESHADLLPAALVQWARFTLELDLTTLSRHVSVLEPSPESLAYRTLLAEALGAVAVTGPG